MYEIYEKLFHFVIKFAKHHSDFIYKYSEAAIKNMLESLTNNSYVVFGDQVFHQSVGISMGINCAPLLDDLFFRNV